jgi:hypothetical protein
MKILSFPSNKLNSTRNIFEIISESPIYSQLNKFNDVVFINVDGENLHELYQDPEFYDTWFNDDMFKIAIVHETHTSTLPFLKVADHIIVFNEIQSDVINKVVKMDIPTTILPYPTINNSITPKTEQILFSADFDSTLCDKYLHVAATWSSADSDDEFDIIQIEDGETTVKSNKDTSLKQYPFTAIFNVSDNERREHNEFFTTFENTLRETTISYKIVYTEDNSEYKELLATSEYSYIFNEEIATEEAKEMISEESLQIIYTQITENASLADSLANNCKIIIAEGVSAINLDKRPSIDEYVNELLNVIQTHKDVSFNKKSKLINSIPVDVLSDLDIIEGQPLTNKYVFIVNFRNQSDKIERCIQSILDQNNSYDFGIAVTDDLSTDDSLEKVMNLLDRSNIDHIVTRTTERKYSARNLYNAVTLLVNNPDSVIIEVDGDDFLYMNTVLDVINPHYNNGVVKTFGNFITYPVKWDEMESNTLNHDIRTPWHQGKCSAWLPLRTFKKQLFEQVELDYFLDRTDKTWLKTADDASVNPRMMELANGNVQYIDEQLYAYDVSGEAHDVGDDWSPIPSYKTLYHIITF